MGQDENSNDVIDVDATPPPNSSYYQVVTPINPHQQYNSLSILDKADDQDNVNFVLTEFETLMLNAEENKRATDPKYVFNFSHFPKMFKDPTSALDTYNQLGYPHRMQFKRYELKKKEGKILMFSLCCAKRDQPKYHFRYHFNQANIKLSE